MLVLATRKLDLINFTNAAENQRRVMSITFYLTIGQLLFSINAAEINIKEHQF
jgi:hypothetical protein